MKKTKTKIHLSQFSLHAILICISFITIQLKTYGQAIENLNKKEGFIKEDGQFKTFNNLKFQFKYKNTFIYFLTDRVVFITKGVKYEDNEESIEAASKGNNNLAKKLSAVTEVNRFDLLFLNSNQNTKIYGEEQKELKIDYYLGHCPDGILNVPAFDKIRYKNIYPNIDLVFYQDGDLLKYEFIVYPNGDPSLIKLQWDGINDLLINDQNEIQFNVASFNFIDKAPVSFTNDKKIKTSYSIINNHIEFELGNFNNQDTLIIDPALYWSSSLEYNGYGSWGEMVANSTGEYYFVDWEWNPGSTDVSNYLDSAGTSTLYSSDMTNNDIIISKFSKSSNLIWACRYGGTGNDDVYGAVTIDDNDNLYIAGTSKKESSAASGNFPLQTWTGAFYQGWDGSLSTGSRGFLLKFLPDNSRQWATYLDRGANLEVFDIECGINNSMYLVGKSGGSPTYIQSGSIPSGTGYAGALNGTTTAHSFILEFNNSGVLAWATWLPGIAASTYTGRACDITINKSNGYVYVAGDEMWSYSTAFSASLIAASYTNLGQNDLFYMCFNSNNQPVPSYGNYVGGAGFDKINIGASNGDIELDANGNLYMCGHTYSANFPTLDPGGCTYFDGTINDGSGITANVASVQDGYLFKVNTSGTIIYSTFFGGTAYTSMKKLKKDSHDNLWICGVQNPVGLATVNHNDYYNQTIAGTSSNIMFSQLKDDDRMEWLSYYGFSSGYSGYSGFDIWEPSTDSIYLYLAGKFNILSNTGGGYQYTASASCTGAAQFRHYLSSSAPFTISGPNPICAGSTATWTSTSPGGSWSSSNTSIATINSSSGLVTGISAGTVDITYTLNISGCDYDVTETITIIASAIPPTSVTASQTSICNGSSSTLSYTGGSGTIFNWYTGSCGGTLIGTGNNFSVSPASTTTYYGAWESSCGTSSCESVTITVNPLPVTPTSVSASQTSICNGDSTTLSYTGGSGTTFNWYSGSCGGTLVGTGNNFSVSPTTTTTYYGAWTNSCGTSTCESVTITINPAPTPTITGALSFCTGNNTTLDAGSGYTNYEWTGGGTNQTNIVTTGGSYTVTVTDANGCTGTDNVTVTENASLSPNISGNLDFCSGDSTTLDAGSGYNTYNWSPYGSTQNIVVTSAGNYSVTVSDVNGCTGTDDVLVVENPNPIPVISGNLSFCDEYYTILDAGSGYSDYLWTGADTTQTITVSTAGNYTVTVTDANGCSGSDNVTVTENQASITNNSISICNGDSVLIYGTWQSQAGVYYDSLSTTQGCDSIIVTTLNLSSGTSINFEPVGTVCANVPYINLSATPSGGVFSGAGITDATNGVFVPNLAGIGSHNIIYTIAGACGNSDTITIVVDSVPNAAISGENEIMFGGSSILTASSGDSYLWSSSGNIDCDNCQSIDVSPSGLTTYCVTIAYDNGCSDSACVTVYVNKDCGELFIPNAFSPNGDGFNDVLYVRGECIAAMHLTIYDRWGELVFESENQDIGWDGTYKGKKLDDAVFMYYLKVSFTNKKDEELKGNISLIR